MTLGEKIQKLRKQRGLSQEALAEKVKAMGLDSVLIIVDQDSENLYLAARNLHKVAVVEPQHADPLSLVQYQKVLVSKAAIAKIEELLK